MSKKTRTVTIRRADGVEQRYHVAGAAAPKAPAPVPPVAVHRELRASSVTPRVSPSAPTRLYDPAVELDNLRRAMRHPALLEFRARREVKALRAELEALFGPIDWTDRYDYEVEALGRRDASDPLARYTGAVGRYGQPVDFYE